MKENAVPRRPKKAAFAAMCVLLAVLLVVNVAAIALIPPNFDMINSFLYSGPSGEEVDSAKAASAAMTQRVEGEGIVLLENKGNALPLQSGAAVNLFGYGSRDTVYGGTGSGSGDSSKNVTLAKGLENAGFQVNSDLVSFYDSHYIERVGVGYTGSNFDINETPLSEYPNDLIQGAKDFSDVAIFVISRFGGEGADLPMDMTPGDTEISSAGAATSVDAALWIGCLGSTGANAVGEVLSGKVNPSGRTTDTFAYEVESAPSYYAIGKYDYTNVQYTNINPIAGGGEPEQYHYVDYIEGIYVGYRYSYHS